MQILYLFFLKGPGIVYLLHVAFKNDPCAVWTFVQCCVSYRLLVLSRREVYHMQRELIKERARCQSLQEELESPMNVHRWRRLEVCTVLSTMWV